MVSGAKPSSLGNYTDAMALAIAALSLNLLFGFNGQISLGNSAFAGIAAFYLGYTVRFWDNMPFVSLLEACVLCFVIGLVIGLPALRLKGPYLALVTLAIAYVWPTVAAQFIDRKVTAVTGESAITKFRVTPPTWTGLKNTRADRALYLFWVGLVLMIDLLRDRSQPPQESHRSVAGRGPRQRDCCRGDGRQPGARTRRSRSASRRRWPVCRAG